MGYGLIGVVVKTSALRAADPGFDSRLQRWGFSGLSNTGDLLHVISAQCFACDLHTIAPGPLECACWRWFAVQQGDCVKF